MTDMNNMMKISVEEVENVSSGYVYVDPDSKHYEVIDDKTGEILACGYKSIGEARKKARKLGQSAYKVSDEYLERLRENYIA